MPVTEENGMMTVGGWLIMARPPASSQEGRRKEGHTTHFPIPHGMPQTRLPYFWWRLKH